MFCIRPIYVAVLWVTFLSIVILSSCAVRLDGQDVEKQPLTETKLSEINQVVNFFHAYDKYGIGFFVGQNIDLDKWYHLKCDSDLMRGWTFDDVPLLKHMQTAHFELDNAKKNRKDLSNAKAALGQIELAIAASDQSVLALMMKAEVLEILKRNDEALVACKKAFEKNCLLFQPLIELQNRMGREDANEDILIETQNA